MKKLSLLFMVVTVLFTGCNAQEANQSADQESTTVFKDVNVQAFKKLVDEKSDEIVLDVRTPDEVSQGMIPNAQHIDFYAEDFKAQVDKLDKEKPVLVYCAAGGRSAKAQSMMKDLGFKEVYNLEGGYTAWHAAKK